MKHYIRPGPVYTNIHSHLYTFTRTNSTVKNIKERRRKNNWNQQLILLMVNKIRCNGDRKKNYTDLASMVDRSVSPERANWLPWIKLRSSRSKKNMGKNRKAYRYTLLRYQKENRERKLLNLNSCGKKGKIGGTGSCEKNQINGKVGFRVILFLLVYLKMYVIFFVWSILISDPC